VDLHVGVGDGLDLRALHMPIHTQTHTRRPAPPSARCGNGLGQLPPPPAVLGTDQSGSLILTYPLLCACIRMPLVKGHEVH
jgi:hypothetical protein